MSTIKGTELASELVRSLAAAVYTCDVNGRVTMFNEAAAELWGRRPELGKDLWCGSWRLFGTDGREIRLDDCPMAIALREGRAVRGEEVIVVRPDGQRRYVLPHPEPLFDADGEIVGAVNMLVDVTDLKRTEARNRLLLAIDDATYPLSDPQEILQAAARLLIDHLDATGCAYVDVEDDFNTFQLAGGDDGVCPMEGEPSPLARYGVNCLSALQHGMSFICDCVEADGRLAEPPAGVGAVIWAPLMKCGRLVAAMAVHTDEARRWRRDEVDLVNAVAGRCWESIERSRIARSLRESERRYRGIVEGQSEMICRFRPDGAILFVNTPYARLRGVPADSLIGVNFWEFIPEEEHAEVRRQLSTLSPETPLVRIENRFQTSTGPRWTLWTNQALSFDERGRVTEVQSCGIDITDRRRAEDALRESETRFRVMADAAPVLIWMSGVDRESTWFNRRWLEFVDGTMEEELGSGWTRNVHPDDLGPCLATCRRAMAAGEPFAVEYRLRRHDGEYRWILDDGAPLHGPSGDFRSYIGSCVDITERKRAAEMAAERERHLRAIIDNTPECVKIVAPGGHLRYMNPAGLGIFGAADLEQVRGSCIFEVIAPEHRDRYMEMHERVCNGEKVSLQFDIIGLHGERRHMQTNAVPLLSPDGRVEHLALTRDITAHRRAEEALRESGERFRTLADHISQFAWMADETGWIFWYNQRWYDYTGTTFDEMQGWGWRAVHHPDHVEAVTHKFKDHIARGIPWEDTFPLRGRDGDYRWFLSRALPIRDEDGRVRRWFGTNTDVTEQRVVEQALAQHKEHLERRVQERTAELRESHMRLRLSERMALLGTLSAGLGHDMGNLLVPVRVCLESLEAAELSEELRAHVHEIRTSADYLKQLANGLRLMAIDPERVRNNESTSLQAWWKDAAPVMKTALPRGITLEASFEDGLWVRMSRAAVTQAVFNLVQNAGEAMRGRESGVVRVGARRVGKVARLLIEDNGPGMPAEVRDHCLEPFFTTKTRDVSTGLGLVLVTGLVRDAGGEVELDSEPGRGTRFTLTIPADEPIADVLTQQGPRRRAVVRLPDARLRAFVTAELRSLAFDVADVAEGSAADGKQDIDLAVVGADPASLRARRVIAFTANGFAHDGSDGSIVALGASPRPGAIRDALRQAADALSRRPPADARRPRTVDHLHPVR